MPNSTVRPCTIVPSAFLSRMPVQALAVVDAASAVIAVAARPRKSMDLRFIGGAPVALEGSTSAYPFTDLGRVRTVDRIAPFRTFGAKS